MPHPQAKIHRMYELVEPIATVTFSEGPNEAFLALGMRNYWDGYFAGRAAPLGLAPAGVVHAVFYNFADGEVARHIPWVWGRTTPQEAIAVRERGSAAALRQVTGELADAPGLVRVADLATRAALSAPTEGRALYAGLRALDVPEEPVARLWHAATLLREHRGDGHNAALVAHGIGGTEAHVLLALSLGIRAEEFRPTPPPAQGTAGRCHRRAARPRPRRRRRRVHRRRPTDQAADRGPHRRTGGAGVRRAQRGPARRADRGARADHRRGTGPRGLNGCIR